MSKQTILDEASQKLIQHKNTTEIQLKNLINFYEKHGQEFKKWWLNLDLEKKKKILMEISNHSIPQGDEDPEYSKTFSFVLTPELTIGYMTKNNGKDLFETIEAYVYNNEAMYEKELIRFRTVKKNLGKSFVIDGYNDNAFIIQGKWYNFTEKARQKDMKEIDKWIEMGIAIEGTVYGAIEVRRGYLISTFTLLADEYQDLELGEKIQNKLTLHGGAYLKKCFNCDKIESKDQKFLICDGCKMAFYCSKECQKNNWKNHKKYCSKSIKTCYYCKKIEEIEKDFKVCSACHQAVYCSKDCQVQHWKIHKKDCKKV